MIGEPCSARASSSARASAARPACSSRGISASSSGVSHHRCCSAGALVAFGLDLALGFTEVALAAAGSVCLCLGFSAA